ncbi:Sentrin-specific protease [Abeliophyllum distichum]|uniref:Sentrin-specific protease n=1 Tax=Abeliophyllum distichum TaxID=126358 RepID=A0ABD1QIF2_9LAMI
MTEGQWRKNVDATTFDLFREVDPIKDKEFSAWYNQLGDSHSHWFAVEVDIAKSTMFIYNPDKSYSMDDQIKADLKPMTTILPMLLKKINIVIVTLAIERITTTSKQSNSSDCGVYAIKYIEFLSISRQAELVNIFHMPKWRRKLAVELYTLDCTT